MKKSGPKFYRRMCPPIQAEKSPSFAVHPAKPNFITATFGMRRGRRCLFKFADARWFFFNENAVSFDSFLSGGRDEFASSRKM